MSDVHYYEVRHKACGQVVSVFSAEWTLPDMLSGEGPTTLEDLATALAYEHEKRGCPNPSMQGVMSIAEVSRSRFQEFAVPGQSECLFNADEGKEGRDDDA